MNSAETQHKGSTEALLTGAWFPKAFAVGVLSLLGAVGVGVAQGDGGKHFFHSYLVGVLCVLTVSLGALFFVALQHLTRAGWSVAVRRFAELLAANVWVPGVMMLPILVSVLLGNSSLYSWVNHHGLEHAQLEMLEKKAAYLNVPFFVVRALGYIAVWVLASRFYLKRSLAQDVSKNPRITLEVQKRSPVVMIFFALTLSFAAFDWVMSMDPYWYSTMFGVYVFAGSVLSFFAVMVLGISTLEKQGPLKGVVNQEHYHDLGKFLFGFVFFWGYIAFSQFMLIWYANIPEETVWFKHRTSGSWVAICAVLVLGHFVIPFAGLLSRHVKRKVCVLRMWALFLLVMHWADLYWLVMPNYDAHHVPLHVLDVLCVLGVAGVYVAMLARSMAGKHAVAVGDPRLHESLGFENI